MKGLAEPKGDFGAPDDELPEVTDDDLDRAVFSVGDVAAPTPRRRGRPTRGGKKELVTLTPVEALNRIAERRKKLEGK